MTESNTDTPCFSRRATVASYRHQQDAPRDVEPRQPPRYFCCPHGVWPRSPSGYKTTRLGSLLTGTVLVILMAIVAANAGLIPHQAPSL